MELFSQYVVQVFFMISGFYAYSKTQNLDVIKRRFYRTGKLTVLSLLLYFTYTLLFKLKYGIASQWLAQFLNWETWSEILFFTNFEIIGGLHLWFLPALLFSYLVLFFLIKSNKVKMAYRIIPLLFAIKFVGSTIVLSNNYSWHYTSNIWIFPLPWVLTGYYIAENNDKVKQLPNWLSLTTAIVGLIVDELFIVISFPINLAEIGKMLYSIGLFVLAVNNPDVSISRVIEKIGDEYYLYVYIIHLIVLDLLEKVALKLKIIESDYYIWAKPLLVLVISILGSIQIHYLLGLGKKWQENKKLHLV